jgi:hypothetical protein
LGIIAVKPERDTHGGPLVTFEGGELFLPERAPWFARSRDLSHFTWMRKLGVVGMMLEQEYKLHAEYLLA